MGLVVWFDLRGGGDGGGHDGVGDGGDEPGVLGRVRLMPAERGGEGFLLDWLVQVSERYILGIDVSMEGDTCTNRSTSPALPEGWSGSRGERSHP